MMEKRIDATDMRIIRLLQQNGRMSNTDIAKKAGISETTVRYRLQRLTKEEFIQIVAMVNPLKLGFGIEGSIRIKADIKAIHKIAEKLKAIDSLYFVARSMGVYDFETEYYVKSSTELKTLIDTINAIEGVLDTEVSTVLDYVKERYDFGEIGEG
ncbi:MAG: Lrp/AsnC family transcriptional regulator [Deltaproteobacteria bacterium]|nr:Lrp/AsnC family transcriptional regulator [Deltaproteobacteria bacterium]